MHLYALFIFFIQIQNFSNCIADYIDSAQEVLDISYNHYFNSFF